MTDQSARARAVEAERQLYRQIVGEFGLLTAEEADRHLGSPAATARAEGRLLGIDREQRVIYPGFQFGGHDIRPVIARLIDVGRQHGRTELGLIQWLVSPTTYLHGKRPVDVIDVPDKLLETARSSFGVEW